MLSVSFDIGICSPSYTTYLQDLAGMNIYMAPVSFSELKLGTPHICSCCPSATESKSHEWRAIEQFRHFSTDLYTLVQARHLPCNIQETLIFMEWKLEIRLNIPTCLKCHNGSMLPERKVTISDHPFSLSTRGLLVLQFWDIIFPIFL